MDASRPRGRILTFYSYKGGTGRSMALANIAWLLACNGRRVLAIDWDLEAPGLHRYFHPFLIDKELSASHGLIDMVDNYANQAIRPLEPGTTPDPDWYLEYTDFSEYIVSVNFKHFGKGGKIDLLPAGRQDDRYAVMVSSFNWQNFFDRLGGGGFFEAVKARARGSYDYVLIDSRTGVSDTAGICSVQMPDSLVVCFTYNNQSIKGAAAVARSAMALHEKVCDGQRAARRGSDSRLIGELEDTPLPYRVFPVPMRVDPGESDRLAVRQAFARESFLDLMGHLTPSEIAEYWTRVEVPHTSFYSYEEVLSPFKDDAHDPKTVLAAFLRLTQYLTDGDVTDFRLPLSPDERRQWLDAFGETPLTARARTAQAEPRRESEEAVLARTADAALAALTDQERVLARRVLSRLVRLGREDEGGGCYPIRASIADFNDAEQRVIAELSSYGLVKVTTDTRAASSRSSAGGSDRTVALADERLLTAWRGVTDWVAADREFLMWRQQMRTYLADWLRSGRDSGALLSGRLLGEADGWTLRRHDDLNAAELEYVESSRRPAVPEPRYPRAAAPRSGWWKVAMIAGLLIALALVYIEVSLHWATGPRTSGAPAPAGTNASTQAAAAPPSPDGPASGPAGPGSRVDAAAVDALVREGERLLSYGNAAGAQEAYSKAIQLDPNNERAFNGLRRLKESLPPPVPPSRKSRVVLQYEDATDAERARVLQTMLSADLRPIEVQPPQPVRGTIGGKVRYVFPDDQDLAKKVKSVTEAALRKAGLPVTLDLSRENEKTSPGATPGTIDVRLPPLVARLYISAANSAVAKRMDLVSQKLRSPGIAVTVRQDPNCYSSGLRYVFPEDAAEARQLASKLTGLGIRVTPVLDKAASERRRHFDLCVAQPSKKSAPLPD